jgi:RimJ/RimL family protein N-acetyltransferase
MRPLQRSDAEIYTAFYTDPDVMRYIEVPLSIDQAQRSFERAFSPGSQARGAHVFVMEEAKTAAIVGLCGTSRVVPEKMRAEVGIMLKSEARGLGFATEGLSGTLGAVFDGFPSVQCVAAWCSSLNERVERMILPMGFRLVDPQAAARGPLAMRQWHVQRSSWNQAQTTAKGDQPCRM